MRYGGKAQVGEADQAGIDEKRDADTADRSHDRGLIGVADSREAAVEAAEEAAEEAVHDPRQDVGLGAMRLQQHGGQVPGRG